MSITDQGKVVTCAVDLDARFVAGNITKQTLQEVWIYHPVPIFMLKQRLFRL